MKKVENDTHTLTPNKRGSTDVYQMFRINSWMSRCARLCLHLVVVWTVVSAGDYAGFPGCGLLRLHSTYRHDLKIYASDEGRVQMTAAAFAKVKLQEHKPRGQSETHPTVSRSQTPMSS